MASDVTFSSVISGAKDTNIATATLADDFSDFLNLLTVQLKNQDPLSPMETNEFTNQLVAFTGVEQQINTNQKLDDLVALNLSNTFSTALTYVGLNANYLSSELYFDGSTPVETSFVVEEGSVDTKINITNEDGDIVYTQSIDPDSDVNEFVWNGQTTGGNQVEPGTYTIDIAALDANGNGLETSTVVKGQVSGLEMQDGVLFLLVGERAVALSQIINVTDPNAQQNNINTTDENDTEESENTEEA